MGEIVFAQAGGGTITTLIWGGGKICVPLPGTLLGRSHNRKVTGGKLPDFAVTTEGLESS